MPRWERTPLSEGELAGRLEAVWPYLEQPPSARDGRADAVQELAALAVPADVLETWKARRPGSAVLVQVARADGSVVHAAWMDPELARQGVVVAPLSQAVEQLESVVQEHLATRALPASFSKLAALAAAVWDAGQLVYVPAGVQVAQPVEVVLWAEPGRRALFPRTLVVLGEQARLALVETWGSSPGGEGMLAVGGVELVTQPYARLDYACLQRWDSQVTAFTHRRAYLENDSQVEWAIGEFGAGLARSDFEAQLHGRGSSSHSVMVFFAGQRQHLDLASSMEHRGTHTESDIVARGVLTGQARGIYQAVTHIRSGARSSGSWQKGNILVLSQDARADANPTVIVEENDVLRAGHAATVGKVDPEQLFYLMSRGLPHALAVQLMVEGFLQPVLEKIPVEAVRELIRDLVARRLQEAFGAAGS